MDVPFCILPWQQGPVTLQTRRQQRSPLIGVSDECLETKADVPARLWRKKTQEPPATAWGQTRCSDACFWLEPQHVVIVSLYVCQCVIRGATDCLKYTQAPFRYKKQHICNKVKAAMCRIVSLKGRCNIPSFKLAACRSVKKWQKLQISKRNFFFSKISFKLTSRICVLHGTIKTGLKHIYNCVSLHSQP